jgi:hypothetical protein
MWVQDWAKRVAAGQSLLGLRNKLAETIDQFDALISGEAAQSQKDYQELD